MKTINILPLALLGSLIPGKNSALAAQPTNFVIINFDDAGNGDFSYLGAVGYQTPVIDRIAAEGLNLTNFYAVQPISGASRSGLMTGCYPNRIGFAYAPNPNSPMGLHPDETTIAEMLKQRDYRTAIFGKWHLGDHQKFLPLQHGFDEYYGLPYSNDMWPHHPTDKYPDLPLIEGNKVLGYNTDQSKLTTDYTTHAVDFIKRSAGKPFFLYLAHTMPHVPLAVSDKFKGKSEQGLYGDVMMELDWSVEQVFNALREQGVEENTMVIITSDNGPWVKYGNHAGSSGGLREAKATTFNGGLRVPCIVYWKGHIQPGSTSNALMSNIDILPTIAGIADVQLPERKIDGINMGDVIRGKGVESPRKSLCMYFHNNSLEAVTDGLYKLVFPHEYVSYYTRVPGNDGQPGDFDMKKITECELYDLRRDPAERTDVASQHPEIVSKLKQIADTCRAELGDDLTGAEGTQRRVAGSVK